MVLYRQEDALSDEFESVINFEQEHLDDMWRVTVQKLVTGYSLYIKATRRSLLTSFGPAMNNVPVYMAMTEEERKRLCRDVNQIKRVAAMAKYYKQLDASSYDLCRREEVLHISIGELERL